VRIALTHPYCWPYVQRGGERLFADLTRYLASRGHDVVTVSAGPERGSRLEDGVLAVRHRALNSPRLARHDIDQPVTYLPQAAWSLRRHKPDVVHGMFHLDGVAARLAGRRPYVVHVQGMPSRQVAERRRVHARLLPYSMGRAAAVIAVSRAAANQLAADFGLEARPVLNGVFTDDFRRAPGADRSDTPTILFPGDPDDPRKRIDVLATAVEQLLPSWPGLRLSIAAPPSPDVAARLHARLGPALELLDVASPSEMPAAYARAWVTCLPAVREAFGLVFIESLAAGTPAVGIRDGGVPEVLGEPAWLAAPDDPADLAAALHRALTAQRESRLEDMCVELARPFDWSARGPAFEALYEEVTAAAGR